LIFAQIAHQPNRTERKGATHDNSPFGGVDSHFIDFHRRYSPIFQLRTRDVNRIAEQYFKGLIQASKKNMERMAEAVPDCNDQSLQHFLTNSPWDDQLVVGQVAHDANTLLGGRGNSCLNLDESGMPKKGDKSVGVSRQWCGQLGKTDNCQVGVYSTLCHGEHAVPIGFRLFLTQTWVDDPQRCRQAGVPDEYIEFHRKHDLALQLVIEARVNGVQFEWIGADSFYGKDPAFLRTLDQMHETFMVDVHKSQHIYLEDPAPRVPPATSRKGRKPTKLKAQCASIRADKWAEQQPRSKWKRTCVRDTTKGKLQVEILHHRVWLWDGKESKDNCWHLIVRREIKTKEVKYSLSNAPASTSYRRLVFMQAQRYWIERNFQDAKNQCGMGEYQARKWQSWHHHMAMVMMAMLFMVEQRMLFEHSYPLLSCFDIVSILKFLLPRRAVTLEEVIRQLEFRHKRRQASIDFAYQKQLEHELSESAVNL
jgi:SRSO17 transposase